MMSPLRPSISAGASGFSLPAARTNSGTDRFGISTSGYGLVRATGRSPWVLVWRQSHLPRWIRGMGVTRWSPGPEHRLRAAEQGDRLPGVGIRDDGVPDLGRPAGVHVGRRAVDPALARRPE